MGKVSQELLDQEKKLAQAIRACQDHETRKELMAELIELQYQMDEILGIKHEKHR